MHQKQDLESTLRRFSELQQRVAEVPSALQHAPLLLDLGPLKGALRTEAAAAKSRFAAALHAGALRDLRALDAALKDATVRVSRPLHDLEDVQLVTEALQGVRAREADFESQAGPLEDVFALLAKHEVKVAKEDVDMVGDLRYTWRTLRRAALEASEKLLQLQPSMHASLQAEVTAFVEEANSFAKQWVEEGPMVAGLEPLEAAARLRTFAHLFEVGTVVCMLAAWSLFAKR